MRDFYPAIRGGLNCTGESTRKCNNTTPCPNIPEYMEIEYDNPTDCKSNPNGEADPLCITEYEDNGPIDCGWKEWGDCSSTCGEGIEVLNFLTFSAFL